MKRWCCILFALGLVACMARPTQLPDIRLESPQAGLEVAQGERVLVQSIAQDERGVVKTELWVDGRLYEVSRSSEPGGNLQFDAIQIWQASTLGAHTLVVKAHSADGRVSEPVSVEVRVAVISVTPTPEVLPTPTAVVQDGGCIPSARFVEDVTIPDDSLFNSGVNLTKTWRLRNDGTCAWPEGTVWAFIGGDLMGAQSPVQVELAEPDRIIDISVDMVAPASPGTYKSYWRMQSPSGEFFGDQAYVRIVVP